MWNPTPQISDRDLLLLLPSLNMLILFIQALHLSETESSLYQERQLFFPSLCLKEFFYICFKMQLCSSSVIWLPLHCISVIPYEIYLAHKQKFFLKKFYTVVQLGLANSFESKSLKCTSAECSPTLTVQCKKVSECKPAAVQKTV